VGGGRRPAVREERNIRRGANEQSISHKGRRRKRGGGRSSGENKKWPGRSLTIHEGFYLVIP